MIILPPQEIATLVFKTGRIVISADFLFDNPLRVAQAFALLGFVPYQITQDRPRKLTYWGISPKFDSTTPGSNPPLYLAELEEQDGVVVSVDIKKDENES